MNDSPHGNLLHAAYLPLLILRASARRTRDLRLSRAIDVQVRTVLSTGLWPPLFLLRVGRCWMDPSHKPERYASMQGGHFLAS